MAIQSENPSGILAHTQFESFEEFSELAVGWDADFRQLDAERFKPDIFQAQIESILVTGGRFGCHTSHRGATPAGMRAFAVPDMDCSEMRWFGHVIGPDVLLSFPTLGEIDVHAKPGFGVATFSIPEALLSDFLERNRGYTPDKVLGPSEKVIHAPRLLLNKMRHLYQQLQNTDESNGTLEYWRARHLEIQENILACLLEIIDSNEPVTPQAVSWNRHKPNQLLELMNSHAEESPRISNLCATVQIPERTAQYLFKRELGITPKAYLIGQRIYIAHRELWQADPSKLCVSDVANRLGFWRMGKFAADYKRLFRMLPSETLKSFRSQIS